MYTCVHVYMYTYMCICADMYTVYIHTCVYIYVPKFEYIKIACIQVTAHTT